MCRINILVQRKRKVPINSDILAAFAAANKLNFRTNNDGEGVVSVFELANKSSDTFMISDSSLKGLSLTKQEESEDLLMLADHTRKATTTINGRSVQPFYRSVGIEVNGETIYKNISFMHNGVMRLKGYKTMNNAKEEDISDSYYFFEKVIEYLKDNGGNMEEAIQKVFDNDYQSGSFSIAIVYDKDLYYFKNSSTNMYFYVTNTALILSTANDYKDMINTYVERDLKPNLIYLFKNKEAKKGNVNYDTYVRHLDVPTHSVENYGYRYPDYSSNYHLPYYEKEKRNEFFKHV